MKKKILIISGVIATLIVILLIMLPSLLKMMGYHPSYEKTEYNLTNMKALIITTSHETLGKDLDDREGAKTGVYPSEMTIPYYEFFDAGMKVDLASIQGGKIPLEPRGTRWPLASHQDRRFFDDDNAMDKLNNSLKIDDVDFLEYDIIFISGGWGAAYDIATSEVLGDKITEANADDILLGAVCHGPLGFINAKEVDGKPLVEGKTITGVTDKQVKELNIEITPYHPEEELRKQGANFVSNTKFRDFFASYVAIDGNIVTGQNQNSSGETAQELLKLLSEKE
jgi:putative intracellular protease/amidase